MDAVAGILKRELHKLMIDGIKYEKRSDQEYRMGLFEEKEIISYLNNRLTHVCENAETRQPACEQASDPVRKNNIDCREPSLPKPHHENA